jgi:hypothetical protein
VFTARTEPFSLLDPALEPRRRERRQLSVRVGRRFVIADQQSAYLTRPDGRAVLYLAVGNVVSDGTGGVRVEAIVQAPPVQGEPQSWRFNVLLGRAVDVRTEAGAWRVRVERVRSFVEDRRTGLNRPSPVGYELTVIADAV